MQRHRREPGRARALPLVMLVLAALLLGADALAWLGMQKLLDHRLQGLARDAKRSGWQFEIAASRRGGWPLAATLTLTAPRLHGAEALLPGGVTWSGERVTLVFSPLHPGRLTLRAGGTQTISAGAGLDLGHSLRLWAAAAALHLPETAGGAAGRVGFDARALHIALPGAGPDDVLTVAGLEGAWLWNGDAHAVRLALRGLGLARMQPRIVPAASLQASLIGAPAALRGGRDAGGRILLQQAALAWSDTAIEASGTASLDADLRPQGAFSVRIRRPDALLDRLMHAGRVSVADAGAIRAVLGLLHDAKDAGDARGAGSGGDSLDLPLTLRDGTFLLGQIPLLRLPVLSPTTALP